MIESDSAASRKISDETLLRLSEILEVSDMDLSETLYSNFNDFYSK